MTAAASTSVVPSSVDDGCVAAVTMTVPAMMATAPVMAAPVMAASMMAATACRSSNRSQHHHHYQGDHDARRYSTRFVSIEAGPLQDNHVAFDGMAPGFENTGKF